MKGKIIYTRDEAKKIRALINQKVRASKYEQKRIRDKIRAIGFYFSDFSNKKGYTVNDFEALIKNKQINIYDTAETKIIEPKINISFSKDNLSKPENVQPMEGTDFTGIETKLITKGDYYEARGVDSILPTDQTGFYSIRLAINKSLPPKYQSILIKRPHRIVYIGKAESQSLYSRLQQELRATGPGTFFRSIGAILGYLPPFASLKDKKNKNNYKFSDEDKPKIINWINDNLEISWTTYSKDFDLEKELIKKYCPLFNDTHNPLALIELRTDKEKCRVYARGTKSKPTNNISGGDYA